MACAADPNVQYYSQQFYYQVDYLVHPLGY